MYSKDVSGMYSRRIKNQNARWFALLLIVVGGIFFAPAAKASMAFPMAADTNEASDILSNYPPYLNYVIDIGRETNASQASRLFEMYQTLRRTNPAGAARFLKGLRFEMVYRLELTGVAPEKASTRNPDMRRWVTRFTKDWIRECDEHLFRAVAMRASTNAKKK
jgi:hypothetical protein